MKWLLPSNLISGSTLFDSSFGQLKSLAVVANSSLQIDLTLLTSKLQLIQWKVFLGSSVLIDNPCILHGYINTICKKWPPPLLGPNGYLVLSYILVHSVHPSHLLIVHLDNMWLLGIDLFLLCC